jgi:hypothetical protein
LEEATEWKEVKTFTSPEESSIRAGCCLYDPTRTALLVRRKHTVAPRRVIDNTARTVAQSDSEPASQACPIEPVHRIPEQENRVEYSSAARNFMVSTASTLAVLVALFLLGAKWTIDVVREWPRKKSVSSHFTKQHSRLHR